MAHAATTDLPSFTAGTRTVIVDGKYDIIYTGQEDGSVTVRHPGWGQLGYKVVTVEQAQKDWRWYSNQEG